MKRSLSDGRKDAQENGEPQRRRSVKWDEANLEENDKLKAELNPRKIDEPKTPYHGPLDSDEEFSLGDAGMAPLTLEDDAVLEHLATDRNGTSTASGREEDHTHSHHGWSDSERGEQSSGAISNSYSSAGGCNGEEAESNPEASRRHQEKRRRFEARRRQHYNMRDALKRGKELLCEEPEATEALQNWRGSQRHHSGLPDGAHSAENKHKEGP